MAGMLEGKAALITGGGRGIGPPLPFCSPRKEHELLSPIYRKTAFRRLWR
jgi:hypothetical protein